MYNSARPRKKRVTQPNWSLAVHHLFSSGVKRQARCSFCNSFLIQRGEDRENLGSNRSSYLNSLRNYTRFLIITAAGGRHWRKIDYKSSLSALWAETFCEHWEGIWSCLLRSWRNHEYPGEDVCNNCKNCYLGIGLVKLWSLFSKLDNCRTNMNITA